MGPDFRKPCICTVLSSLLVQRLFQKPVRILAAGLLMLGASVATAAERQVRARLALAVEDVRRIARERSREIRKAEQYAHGIRGRYLEEKAAALPQLSLSSYASHKDDKSVFLGPEQTDVAGVTTTVTQPLYTWGRIPAAIRAAEVGLAMADDRLAQARQSAVREALVAWYDALLAEELRVIAAQDLSQKQRHLDEARRKLEAGTVTDYDVLAAEVSVQNARPAVIRADNAAVAARERLRFVLAFDDRTGIELHGTLAVQPGAAPVYAAALEEARRRRPDLAELRNRRKVADEVVTIRRAGTKPTLGLQGTAGWQKIWVQEPTPDGEGFLWTVGLALSWPLFDGQRTKGLVMEAESESATFAIGERELLDAIALEVRRAVDDVREAAEIAAALAGTVAQAERLTAMAEKGFELGVKTRLEVDDARLNQLAARGNLARARRDYLAAGARFDYVTAAPTE